jgi:hypothetical protein
MTQEAHEEQQVEPLKHQAGLQQGKKKHSQKQDRKPCDLGAREAAMGSIPQRLGRPRQPFGRGLDPDGVRWSRPERAPLLISFLSRHRPRRA